MLFSSIPFGHDVIILVHLLELVYYLGGPNPTPCQHIIKLPFPFFFYLLNNIVTLYT